MRMKEVQLLAVLAVIAVSIIVLSMWGRGNDETAENTQDSAATEERQEVRTVAANDFDEIVRIINRQRQSDSDRVVALRDDDILTRRPRANTDDEVVETAPEEIPLRPIEKEKGEVTEKERTATQPVRYTVREGDVLSKISQQHYGTSRHWRDIFEANSDVLESPDKLMPGMTLVIPAVTASAPSGSTASDRPTLSVKVPSEAEAQKYTVQKGDTLWSIAAKIYGDGNRYRDIVEANKALIPNEDALREGTVLTLP